MCGINGFTFKDEHLLQEMLELTKHRGPDDTGVWFDERVSLGHNRLSIIDPSPAGHQPMESSDGRAVITYNGELYNYRALRAELERGYPFRTKTDTEVILAAYQKWGIECLKRFNGMFAFAIWDRSRQELYLARDQIGVKPLYYCQQAGNLIFSSEIKAILKHLPARQLNIDALNAYFRLLYVPGPLTMWQGIHKLLPGHWVCFAKNKLTIQKYWQIESFDTLNNRQEICERILGTFCAAVEQQLVSDKPLGLYLSGGIDSTALLGVMSKLVKVPVKTFTVGFDIKEQSEKYNADFLLARKTSQYFKSDHNEFLVTAKDVKNVFSDTVWQGDDLVTNHTQPTMYLLARETKSLVDVVLTGDGGDELFAGYERYYLNALLDKLQKIPAWLRQGRVMPLVLKLIKRDKDFAKLNMPPGFARYAAFMFQKESMVSRFLRSEFSRSGQAEDLIRGQLFNGSSSLLPKDSTKSLLYADLRSWLSDDALNRADRMSMAHGLEARVPFLDIELVKLAMNIPARFNLDSQTQGKKIFREALKDFIPDFIYSEPKRGWFSPVAKWLRGDLKDWARQILSPEYNQESGQYLDFAAIDAIFQKHLSGEEYALNTIWSIITFQAWFKKYL